MKASGFKAYTARSCFRSSAWWQSQRKPLVASEPRNRGAEDMANDRLLCVIVSAGCRWDYDAALLSSDTKVLTPLAPILGGGSATAPYPRLEGRSLESPLGGHARGGPHGRRDGRRARRSGSTNPAGGLRSARRAPRSPHLDPSATTRLGPKMFAQEVDRHPPGFAACCRVIVAGEAEGEVSRRVGRWLRWRVPPTFPFEAGIQESSSGALERPE